MKIKLPKYVNGYIDQSGKHRYYLRRNGQRLVALPGLPWSPQFMQAYEAALKPDGSIGASRTLPGTINAALVSYYQSRAFTDGLAEGTRQARRAILESFRIDHGDKRVGLMHKQALQHIIDKKQPAAQRNFKKAMRGFIDHCTGQGWIKLDPLAGLKMARMKIKGHHTWTLDEVAQYREKHGPGSNARLALELLLQTGHARADIVRMGRQHVKNGTLSMRRQKTGTPFDIPLLPELVAEIDRHPKSDLAFLIHERGGPYTASGFGNRFRVWCSEAGLVDCSAHGLRKASAVRHALNGASAFELMAWHGWKTIGEAQRYVDEANRIRLAQAAGAKMRTTSD